jgi:N utilization substance protein B
MGRRRQARELALQALYLSDVADIGAREALAIVSIGPKLDEQAADFARALVEGACADRDGLDRRIVEVAENWELGRMACVDRNLLRLASFELLHCPGTPVSVTINEALEIAKTYSGEDSSRFLNGILDKIKDMRGDGG